MGEESRTRERAETVAPPRARWRNGMRKAGRFMGGSWVCELEGPAPNDDEKEVVTSIVLPDWGCDWESEVR